MAKILFEIDTEDLFDNTTMSQDNEIFKEMVEKIPDDILISEVTDKNLLEDVFLNATRGEQEELFLSNAEDFGYKVVEQTYGGLKY